MPYFLRSFGWMSLILLVFCMGRPEKCRSEQLPAVFDSLSRENVLLKERLSRLEARRETFRWGKFVQSLVLVSGTVQQMRQMPDGRLAFATADRGAVFFNGTAFEVIDRDFSGLADDFVTAIAPLPDSGFYLATAAGVQLYKNGTLAPVPDLPAQLENAMITTLAAPDSEHLWLGTQGLGVWRLYPGGHANWRAGADSTDLSNDDISCLIPDTASGKLWAGTAGGGVCFWENNRWHRFEQPLGAGSEDIYSLTVDSAGRVWIGTVGAGAGYWNGLRWQKASLPGEAGSAVVSITELEGADLLFGTDEGAFILDRPQDRWVPLPMPEELAPYPVISAVDAYSRLWLSPSDQGLHLFDRSVVVSYGVEEGLPYNNVYHIAQSADSRIWCSTWNGVGIFDGREWMRIGRRHGLPNDLTTFVLFAGEDTTWFGTHNGVARLAKGDWDYFNRDNGLASNTINHLATDSRGRVWISTEGGGLAALEGDSLKVYRRADGLPADEVQVSAPVGNGDEVWVGTKRGLTRISRGRVVPLAGDSRRSQPVPDQEHITALRLAADGSLWAATYGHGVWRNLPDGTWHQFTMENGLSSNVVFAIAENSEGHLFFGTSMGLSVFDGTYWRSYATADGLPAGAIKNILPGSRGPLWLAVEDHGIISFDLTRFAAPETFIHTPSGLLLSCDTEKGLLVLAAENQSRAPDSTTSPGAGRFVIEGSFYRSPPHGLGMDTLMTGNLTLECLGLTPWWPSPTTGFRFCYQLDNGPWSEHSYQSVIGIYALDRGPHTVSVRAKGPHLRVDPTPAVYNFYVDVPSILSDWRLWAGITGLLLALAALIRRKQIAWYLDRLRYRHFKPITPNPFDPEKPTTKKERFFGRDEALEAIVENFQGEPAGNVAIVIHGREKIGVSSLLLQTVERINSAGGTAVYVDLAGHYLPDISSLLSLLHSRLTDTDSSAPASPDDHEATPDTLRSLLDAGDKQVAFIFDNAELLGRLLQYDTELGEPLVSLFREAVLSEHGASFLFGLHDLDTFRRQCDAFYNMSRIMRLVRVTEDSTRMMITEPLSERAWFQDQALSLLVRLSHGQPFLAHHLGLQLVELINRERTNLCTVELAEQAIKVLVENPPNEILDRWEELGKTEKLLLSAALSTIESLQASTTLAVSDITGILGAHRIGLLEEELAKAAASVADRGMIHLEGAGDRFTLQDSLFNRWVAANQPVEIVNAREEYDFGAVVHKTSEELNRSFNVRELGEQMLESLKAVLRFGWGALLSVGPAVENSDPVSLGCTVSTGLEAESTKLPEELSRPELECLSASSAAVIVGEAAGEPERSTVELPFEDGAIVIPLFSRGGLSGLLALGVRQGGERYSRRDRLLLETISEQATAAIENARLYEEETEKQRMRQELDTARQMQMSLLPERTPEIPHLDFAAYLTPATEVGGDYFDYRLIDEGQFMFIIGDVSGHGISASTLVSMSKSLIYNQIKVSYEVEQVMAAMNDMVHDALAERLLMTLCYTIFDLKNRRLRFSIAGHPFPYHYQAGSGELKELELSAYPLGVTAKAKYAVAETEYASGDVLVFYSDGIVEGANPEGEQLGFQRFEEMILKNKHLNAEEISRNIIEEFSQFAQGHPQDDDITLVVIKAK